MVIDVLPKFVKAYNDTIHSATGDMEEDGVPETRRSRREGCVSRGARRILGIVRFKRDSIRKN